MNCEFTFILPGHVLSLANACALFLNEHDAQIDSTTPTKVIITQLVQHDAHVRAYKRWKRQRDNRLRYEAWCKEELALREQEEAWAIAQQQKRVRLEAEIKGRKANTCITFTKPTWQVTKPTMTA